MKFLPSAEIRVDGERHFSNVTIYYELVDKTFLIDSLSKHHLCFFRKTQCWN